MNRNKLLATVAVLSALVLAGAGCAGGEVGLGGYADNPEDPTTFTKVGTLTELNVNGPATVAGKVVVDTNTLVVDAANNRVGIGTDAPTHSLTLPAASTGIALYNTADQTTDYERGSIYWDTNVFSIGSFKGGSGTLRKTRIYGGDTNQYLEISPSTAPRFLFRKESTSGLAGDFMQVYPGFSASTGNQTTLDVSPSIGQSSTAGYTALLINPTETAIGSGQKSLIRAQVGGVDRFRVANDGTVSITKSATSGGDVIAIANSGTGKDISGTGNTWNVSKTGYGVFAGLNLPHGTTIPATCAVGDVYDDTDSDDCANTAGGDGALCICGSTNVWKLISNF